MTPRASAYDGEGLQQAVPATAASPVVAARREAQEVQALVRWSFLLRLVILLVSLLGFAGSELSTVAIVGVVVVSVLGLAGLWWQDTPAVLQRHPSLVALDALLMTVLMVALGTDNPLVLVTLSSCLIVGLVLRPALAVLSGVLLVNGYLLAALADTDRVSTFLGLFGYPVVFLSVMALGHAVRTTADRKREADHAVADLVTGAAAAQERARLARELHDSTAKTLQGLVLLARALPRWIEKDPVRATQEATDIADSAEEAIVRLRGLLAALRADDLAQPFHESLAAMARSCADVHRVKVELDLDPVRLTGPSVRYELLAAAREALTNAAVHSGADRVTLRLADLGERMCVEVIDEGKGFSMDVLPQREREGHFGVRGYTERLRLVGGEAKVRSAPGEGTTVTLLAPTLGLREESHDR